MFWRRPKKLIRFAYISTRQVSSLSAQFLRRRGGGVKAFVEVSVGATEATGDAGEVRRVLKRLRKTGQLGAVGEGKLYSEGRLPMVWGRLDSNPEVVFFSHKGDPVVGLAGSAASLYAPGAAHTHAHSDMDTIARAVIDGRGDGQGQRNSDQLGRAVGLAVDEAVRRAAMPPRTLHFVAGLEHVGTWDGVDVLFGSPVFVAYTDGDEA